MYKNLFLRNYFNKFGDVDLRKFLGGYLMYKQYQPQKMDFVTQMACDFFQDNAEALDIQILDDTTDTWRVRVVSPHSPTEEFEVTFLGEVYIRLLAKEYKQKAPNISIMQHLRQAIEFSTEFEIVY